MLRKRPPDLTILVLEAISYDINTAPALAALLGGPVQRMSGILYTLLKQRKIKTCGFEKKNGTKGWQDNTTVNKYKIVRGGNTYAKIAA